MTVFYDRGEVLVTEVVLEVAEESYNIREIRGVGVRRRPGWPFWPRSYALVIEYRGAEELVFTGEEWRVLQLARAVRRAKDAANGAYR
jgi:hypothetical protein